MKSIFKVWYLLLVALGLNLFTGASASASCQQPVSRPVSTSANLSDSDLNIGFCGLKYLNPDAGRFWTRDTFEGSQEDVTALHKYLYVNADPVMSSDPSGNLSLAEVTTVSGLVGFLAGITVPNLRGPGEGVDGATYGKRFASCLYHNGGAIVVLTVVAAAGIEYGGAPVPKYPWEYALGSGPGKADVTTRLSRLNVKIAEWVIKNIGPHSSFKALRTIGFVFRSIRVATNPIGAFALGYTVGLIPGCAIAAEE